MDLMDPFRVKENSHMCTGQEYTAAKIGPPWTDAPTLVPHYDSFFVFVGFSRTTMKLQAPVAECHEFYLKCW